MTEPEPPYVRIANEIEQRIRDGALHPGDRVPSTRQITKEWGVAIATATKALVELGARGAVRPIPGVGTVVAGEVTISERPAAHDLPTIRSRATAPEVTRERIIMTAIEIADLEGIGALSMRRIGLNMKVPTMSLYRWISSKDDLVVSMMDHVMGRGDWPAPTGDWREQLEYIAWRQWEGYREHPWLAHVVSLTRPQLAPGAMQHTEWVLRALEPFDLDSTTRIYIVLTLFGHVKGAANGLAAEREAERETGYDIDEYMQRTDAIFATHIQSGRFPSLAKIDGNPDVDFDLTDLFEFGLRLVLDGLAKLLETADEPVEIDR